MKLRSKRKIIKILAFTLILLIAYSCKRTEEHSHGRNLMENSELMAIYDRKDYDEVYIVNPKGGEVAHYVLIAKDDTVPEELPEGATVIKVPLSGSVIDSEVYSSVFEELQSLGLVKGLLDANYVTSPEIKKRLKDGRITDAGQSINPNSEKILSLNPDALIISYYDGMQTEGLEKLGIPVVKMYDLQEATPLGRAEWIKLIGRLIGKEEEADSIFSEVKHRYQSIANNKTKEGTSPTILTEIIYKGTWGVPGGESYPANLIKDAGGRYFKESDKSSVTLNLSPEQVVAEANEADIWLIRYYGDEEEIETILEGDPLYKEIKAYKNGKIYFSNTTSSGLYRETPFHPEKVLQDYQIIFTGDSISPLRYFNKLKRKD